MLRSEDLDQPQRRAGAHQVDAPFAPAIDPRMIGYQTHAQAAQRREILRDEHVEP